MPEDTNETTKKFPLPYWALALILLGGSGGIAAGAGGSAWNASEMRALETKVITNSATIETHKTALAALEVKVSEVNNRQQKIYTNQLLLCVHFELPCVGE